MSSFDRLNNKAKAGPHNPDNPDHKNLYEHEQITDNRQVWEILEGEQ
jgi:hypothetical protein